MCVFVRLVGSLHRNNIGDAGAVGLLEGIKGHPTLRTLDVHDNPMSKESKAALLETIYANNPGLFKVLQAVLDG